MPLKVAMESTAGQFAYGLTQAAEHVIKRKQGAAAKLDDDRFLDLGQNGAPRLARSHRPVGCRGALAPLRHGPGIQAVSGGQGGGALFRCLELGSNTRRRAGCAVKNLAHDASRSLGTKHLIPLARVEVAVVDKMV